MSITYTDAWGTVLDTGLNTALTPRTNTVVEAVPHAAIEIDTGSKLTPGTIKGNPQRSKDSPR